MALPKVQAKREYGGGEVEFNSVVLKVLNELTKQFELLLQKMDTDFADVTNASVDYESTIQTADIAEIELI